LQVQGPYNSVKIYFSVEKSAPSSYPLRIKVKLSCTNAISTATKHNFEPYDD